MLRVIFFYLSLGWLISANSLAIAAEIPAIAAAADLKFALEEISEQFTKKTGKTVKLSFGSSGNFRQQIAQGAPFELFLSADESFVAALSREGHTLDDGALYAIGRIAIIVSRESSLKADSQLKDLSAGLIDGRIKKFAIANPDHAPYGRAAREALIKAGLWDKLQGKLVLGENAAQAAQFALSGSAQGGIIAYSLALSPAVAAGSSFALLPIETHAPLRQRMVLLKNAGNTAKDFYHFVQEPPARGIFKKYGFLLPGE